MKKIIIVITLIHLSLLAAAQKETMGRTLESTKGKPVEDSSMGPKAGNPDQGEKPVKDGSLYGPKPGASGPDTSPQKDEPKLGPKPGTNGPDTKPEKDAPMLGPKPPAPIQPTNKPTKDSLKGADPKLAPVIIKPVKQ